MFIKRCSHKFTKIINMQLLFQPKTLSWLHNFSYHNTHFPISSELSSPSSITPHKRKLESISTFYYWKYLYYFTLSPFPLTETSSIGLIHLEGRSFCLLFQSFFPSRCKVFQLFFFLLSREYTMLLEDSSESRDFKMTIANNVMCL